MTLKEFFKKQEILREHFSYRESATKYEDKPGDKITDVNITYVRLTKCLDNDQDYMVLSKTAAYKVSKKSITLPELQVTCNDGQYGIIMPDSSKEIEIDISDLFD